MTTFEVAYQFLTRDANHRVSLFVENFRLQMRAGTLHPNYQGADDYGVVSDIREVPWASPTPYESANKEYRPYLHYVEQGQYHYFPHMSEIKEWDLDVLFRLPGSTYLPTTMLLRRVWRELQESKALFPEILGMERVSYQDRERELKVLTDSGFFIEMSGYTKKDTPLGNARLLSTGFISRFGLPGEEAKIINTIDASVAMADSISQECQPDSETVVEEAEFLRLLKDKCFHIQREHGPFASKYAWEVYKETARFLSYEKVS
jgi:hypothetical protein